MEGSPKKPKSLSETDAVVVMLSRVKQEQTGDPNARFIVKHNVKCQEPKESKVSDELVECVNGAVDCCDAEEFTQCSTCNATLCESCAKDCDFCINFGDNGCIELSNKCQTCQSRICNNCARMCVNCYDAPELEYPKLECRNCAKGKYETLPCGCEFLWRCVDAKDKIEHDYCPRCRQSVNALGKMGMI